ncbi:hypothetical protein MMC29_000978 [Sticta canariensis]|nr:hypothetical protein [Sticta canariensis]
MRSSYMCLALFAILGASSPVPEILPGLPAQTVPVDRGVNLGNIYYIQYKFSSTGETVTIFTIKDPNNRITPAQTSKSDHAWVGSDLKPVCPLFCANPYADVNVRGQYCLAACRVPQIDPNILYITNTATTGIPGSQLVYCPDQAAGVICSAAPPNAKVAYEG